MGGYVLIQGGEIRGSHLIYTLRMKLIVWSLSDAAAVAQVVMRKAQVGIFTLEIAVRSLTPYVSLLLMSLVGTLLLSLAIQHLPVIILRYQVAPRWFYVKLM